MSNFLFAMGKERSISTLSHQLTELIPNSKEEISISHEIDDYWTLVVDRKPNHIDSSISNIGDTKRGSFFKGWFQDHDSESIVVGPRGYDTWRESFANPEVLNFEGTYNYATLILNFKIPFSSG